MKKAILVCLLLVMVLSVTVFAQRRRGGGRGWRNSGGDFDLSDPQASGGVPRWEVDAEFPQDVFTFARLRYTCMEGWKWSIDYPSSDLNFSLRLQQLTSLKVNPDPVVVDLFSDKVFDYPFLYMIEPGALAFRRDRSRTTATVLPERGFVMVDDFWGDYQYANFEREIKRVFPDREIIDVPLEHEIFHCVYDLKEKPQVPAAEIARQGRPYGITWEDHWGGNCRDVNYRAILDDNQRIMVFICHNTDLGDGWEREGEDEWFFNEFSVKKSYPMGINIVVYAMTH